MQSRLLFCVTKHVYVYMYVSYASYHIFLRQESMFKCMNTSHRLNFVFLSHRIIRMQHAATRAPVSPSVYAHVLVLAS